MREKNRYLKIAAILLLTWTGVLTAAPSWGQEGAENAKTTLLGSNTRLVLEEKALPLELLDASYDPASERVEFSIHNRTERRVTAWTLETAVRVPGVDKPFTVRIVEDVYSDEGRWLEPGQMLRGSVPLQVNDLAPEPRDLVVTFGVGVAVFEDTDYAGSSEAAGHIFTERSAVEWEYGRWLRRISAIRGPSPSTSSAREVLTKLAEMASETRVETKSADGHTVERSVAAEVQTETLAARALASARTNPAVAKRALEKLVTELELQAALARRHTPSAFLRVAESPPGSSAKRPTQENSVISKSTGGSCRLTAGKTDKRENVGFPDFTITENWAFDCLSVSIPGQTLVGAGEEIFGTDCGPEFSGNGAGSWGGYPGINMVWARRVKDGMYTILSGCVIMSSITKISASCPCPSEAGPDPTNPENPDSPIVIDLQRNGFDLTGLEDPVDFDIDADGELETITWTAATTEDSFLALDRDGNGTIDGGHELFGNHTPQPPSDDPNGFLALAVFDAPAQGGDADGWISSADQVFDHLLLWTDRNHDGISQSGELEPLSGSEVAAIRLRYIETRRRDEHGNEFRWSSLVRFTNHQRRLAAVDFIFQEAVE